MKRQVLTLMLCLDFIVLAQDVRTEDSKAIAGVERRAERSQKKNVLFIAVDDLRPELGCYGADHIKSPNIDRLAAQGVLFNRAYCQQAICMTSRASLLTGLRPDSIDGQGAQFRRTLPDVVTLPQHFKNNGYFAQSFEKIFHGSWEKAYGGNYQDPVSWSVSR